MAVRIRTTRISLFLPLVFASVLNIRNRFSDKELSRPFLRKTIHQINKDLQTYRDQDPLGNGDHHGKID